MLIGDEIDLDLRLGRSLPQVKIDPTSLHQVIANLAVNGRDAMDSGGTLTIETRSAFLDSEFFRQRCIMEMPGEYLMISVSDTGCGMDAETRERLFDRFYTTKGPGSGTGLGLTTVDELIAEAGGYIAVDSKVGQGTAFSIYLPAESNSNSICVSNSEINGVGLEEVVKGSAVLDIKRERTPSWRRRPGAAAGVHGKSQFAQ